MTCLWVWLVASPLAGLCVGKYLLRRVWLTQDAIEATDFPVAALHPRNGDTHVQS